MSALPTIGKYVIRKRLGGGHFGEVFLAYDQALACEKAIKVISIANPTEIMQKLQEAQILDKCRHKHIVQINEANIFHNGSNQLLVLDLEYLPEGSLESEMEKRWISVREASLRMSCVLSGLHFAHSNNYLHRDVKPGNVLICGESTKLSDFGLATTTPSLVGSGQGYLAHCPPEFYLTNQTTIQTDVFAAGLTLFRIANNITQWQNMLGTIPMVREHIHNGTLVKTIGYYGHIPEKIKNIINKACHPDPTKRYSNAFEMKNALDSLRFDIDWYKSTSGNWQGFYGRDLYEIQITQRSAGYETVFKKNNRRENSKCSIFSNIGLAHNEAERLVLETTLR
jgi:serine/threonine protein kinase